MRQYSHYHSLSLCCYQDLTVLHPHLERLDGLDRGEPCRAAGRHVELRAMPRTLDLAVVDRAGGEREVAVRAVVAERVDPAVRIRETYVEVADLHAQQRVRRYICQTGDADEAAGRALLHAHAEMRSPIAWRSSSTTPGIGSRS